MSEVAAHDYRVQILERHLDTFGHVNNAAYLEIFEEARWDIISNRGYGLDHVVKTQIGPTILGVNVQFRREIKNREWITIRTTIPQVQGKISTLHQVMINEKGEEACIADFTIGLFDLKARKLILPTPEWLRALGLSNA